MLQRRTGQYVESSTGGARVSAYIPDPLPPTPPLDLEMLLPAYDRASTAVGRLDGVATALPS